MRQISTLILMAGLFLGFSLQAFARPEEGRNGFHKNIMQQLKLTQVQKNQLAKIRKLNKEKMQILRDRQSQLKEKLEVAFAKDTPDAELIKIHEELMSSRQAMGTNRFSNILEVRKVLTKEQRNKFDALKAERKSKRKRHFRHGDEG